MAKLLAGGCAGWSGAGMSLVNHNHFRALLEENVTPALVLDVVNRDDLERVVIVNADITLNLSVQSRPGIGANDDGIQIKLVLDLVLPLFAEVWQADHGKALDPPPLQQFSKDQQSLDGFAYTDVIRNQQANDFLPERHDERHHLIGTWTEGQLGQ